jgi:hypothetical protein
MHEIVVEVLDGQWQDEERTDYTKTTRFGLTDLSCRPAALTLRTAPRFFYKTIHSSRRRAGALRHDGSGACAYD